MTEKYYLIYGSPDGVCFEEYDDMKKVSKQLQYMQDSDDLGLTWGTDFDAGEAVLIRGTRFIPKPKEKITVWEE